jgi:hypothetical protein
METRCVHDGARQFTSDPAELAIRSDRTTSVHQSWTVTSLVTSRHRTGAYPDISILVRGMIGWPAETLEQGYGSAQCTPGEADRTVSAHAGAAGVNPRTRRAALCATGVIAIAASVNALAHSYAGLYDWAVHHRPAGWQAMSWPAEIDVFLAVGELALYVAYLDGWPARQQMWPWATALTGLAVSVAPLTGAGCGRRDRCQDQGHAADGSEYRAAARRQLLLHF